MENADFDNKSNSARKSLFWSPVHQHTRVAGNTGGISNDYFLLGLIQKQCLYIKAMEKEISFYRVNMFHILWYIYCLGFDYPNN